MPGLLSSQVLIEELKTGRTLRFPALHALVRYENGLYYVSLPNCTQRLKEATFLALYGSYPAVRIEEREGIDEEKDEEYYAWRREKQ